MGFPRQEYWSGLPFPSPGDHPDIGIEPRSPTLQADSLPSEPPRNPKYVWQEYRIHHKRQKGPNNHRNVVQLTSLETLLQLRLAFIQAAFFNIFFFLFSGLSTQTSIPECASMHTDSWTHTHKSQREKKEKNRNEERLRQGEEKLTYFFPGLTEISRWQTKLASN